MRSRRDTLPQARRSPFALAVALLATMSLGLVPATALDRSAPASDASRDASALPAQEGDFVARINSLRAGKGLSQLRVSGDLAAVARTWTSRMVGAGQISHNPNLAGEVGGAWTKLGENVGVGYDVASLMQAFIDSPGHYQTLVEPTWNYVGVGVQVAGDGRIYTTHNFMQLPEAAAPLSPPPAPPPPPPPPTPVPTSAPPPSATSAPTTTVSPPTATALAPAPATRAAARPTITPDRIEAVLAALRSIDT
jgi:uncharacterized protein YkwD